MNEITVRAPQHSVVNGWPALAAVIEIEGRAREVYVRANSGPLTDTSDPFLAVALLPAMRLDVPVLVEGTVSSAFVEHIAGIQDVLCTWYPQEMHRVSVQIERVDSARSADEGRRVGSFFSGGIDSFYTALKHPEEINDLIFIHGFDVPLWDTAVREMVSGKLRQAARELSHPLLEVETNLRDVLNPYSDWNLHSHGAALGVVALAVAPQFRRMYIGATFSYAELKFHGSHLLLDPLWGHQNLEIIHEGCEFSRWRKAERIVTTETVQRYLRVCWSNRRTEYNCGRCAKCTMVMIFLRATGMAQYCATFPPLDLGQVARAEILTSSRRLNYDQLLAIAEERAPDPELIQALRERLKRADDDGMGGGSPSPELRKTQAELGGLKVDLKRVTTRLNDLQSSRSWRVTAPLRAASKLARQLGARVSDPAGRSHP